MSIVTHVREKNHRGAAAFGLGESEENALATALGSDKLVPLGDGRGKDHVVFVRNGPTVVSCS